MNQWMRKSKLLFFLFTTAGYIQAQDSVAIHYANTISIEEMEKHLVEISSDEYEGRESGYKGQQMCETYMVNLYKACGIPPVNGTYTQEFKLDLNNPSGVQVSKANQEYTFIEDFYYYPGTGDGKIQGELLYSGYGITDKRYTDINVFNIKDKIVMVWEGEPIREDGKYEVTRSSEPSVWSIDSKKKQELMEENGAKALLIIKPDYEKNKERIAKYFSHKTMNLTEEGKGGKKQMPVLHISEDMAARLMGEKAFKKSKKGLIKGKVKTLSTGDEMEILFKRKEEVLSSSNVMAYIEGSDKKEELIVLTAHYDHIGVEGDKVYNGADDDGSGTVATMMIAKAFALAAKEGHRPRRSILVLNVSAEEKGLLGSKYYTDHPIFPLENTVANLNIDMIGRVDEQHVDNGNYVYLIGADRISQDLHDVGEEVNKKYSGLELDYTFNAEDDPNRFYYRSDHYNFAKHGVPAVFYFSGVHEDYHQPGDTVDKIMFPKLTKITRYIFHTAWEIANREERLRVK